MTDFPASDPHPSDQPPADDADALNAEAAPASSHVPPPEPANPLPGYGAPPPGYVPPALPRRLFRSNGDRKIGGVSAGIAEYFNLDPTVVRLATFVAGFTGVGVLAYLAAWLLVPLRPQGESPPAPVAGTLPSERTMTVAFGLAALALAFGIITDSWEVLAVALIGGGIWLLSEQTRVVQPMVPASGAYGPVPADPATFSSTTFAPPGPLPAGFEPAAFSATENDRWQQGVPAAPDWNAAAPPKERKPQRITWLVFSLLALLAAVGIAAATGNWWNVSGTRFLGIAVIIIGVGVVFGQLRGGGARGLIPLGILAALALFPVSAVDGLIDDGVGESLYRPVAIEDLQSSYQHGVGELMVDLTALDFDDRDEKIDIDLGIGELIVIVSEDVGGSATIEAKAGEISHRLPGTNAFVSQDGVNIESGLVRLQGNDGEVELNISVGLGTAELRLEAN